MLDVLASIALQLAPSVLGELVPILGEKLRQKLLSPTQEGTTPRVEIKDAEIIEKIKETLQKRDELIKDDIKNNHETMKQLIQQVLDEIKILSARTPDLEVGSDEIGLSEPIQQIDKEFDSQELEARLEEIKRSLEESIAKRLTEIQTGLTSQVNNIPLSVIHKDDKQELAPGTNVEMPVPANSPSKIISQTDNITKQVRSEPSKSEQRGNQDEKQGLPLSKNMEAQVPENPQSKIMLENLHKYKEYGEGVLRGLKSLEPYQSSANEILDNRQLQDCLKSLKDAANKTVELASSPVKIAV
ncbi:hypothetical protein, partial [Scytonema sp. PCC 10023]|uniref:hypothetical protein n=1 Tax=Scytonema sp. PCC 10023 TaxID=1680591 RepID=UPI0039C67CB2